MIFSATAFLYLLPLAGLPILFHLILKQKKRIVVFSTLMFFHRVDPKLNTRRQIREWLLLLMRVLMIALLLLALSRPTLRSAVGSGGKLSLVVIIDNSGSMTAGSNTGDLTKLECAKEGARKLLTSSEPDADAAVVLLVDDPVVDVPELLSADRAALLKCLDRINPTEASGDAHRALARAFELLHNSTARGGVVHVFTDLQRAEWADSRGEGVPPLRVAGIVPALRGQDARATEDKGKMPSPRSEDRIHVYLHQIATASLPRPNVAVTGVQLPEQRLLLGQPYEVGLALHNTSDSPADIRVNCTNNRGERSTQNVSLQKQEIATIRLPITMNEPGYHWLKAWVEGDGFAADNTAGIGLFCEGTGTVLFVGQPREFGVLPMALSPSGRGQLTGLVTKFSPSIQLGQADVPLLIVTTLGSLAAAGSNPTELTKYIEAGGNLLVVPSLSPGSDVSSAWLGAGLRTREAYKSGVRLTVPSREAPFWHQIEQVVGDISAESIMAYAFCPLDVPAGFTPLLGAGAKKVVLAQKALGKGNIFVSGLAFSSRWSTLPLSGLGVVMVQRMAVCSVLVKSGEGVPPLRAAGILPAENPQEDKAKMVSPRTPSGVAPNRVLPLVAGERPPVLPADGEMELLSLSGDALDWKGRPTELPAFPRTGVYLATTGGRKSCLSVRASPKEGDWRFVEGASVPILGPVSHTVVPFEAEADYAKYHAGQARVAELYVPLLVLATLALLIEGLLSAARVRSRSTGILPVFRLPKTLHRIRGGSHGRDAHPTGALMEGTT